MFNFSFYWNIQVLSSAWIFIHQLLDRDKLHLNYQLESFCFLNLLCPTGSPHILLRIIQFLFFFKIKFTSPSLIFHAVSNQKSQKGRGSEDSWAQQHHKDNKKKHWIITQKGCKTPIRSIQQHVFHCFSPNWNPDCILASSVESSIRLSWYSRIELQAVTNKSKRFKRETQKPCLSTRWNNFVTSITK